MSGYGCSCSANRRLRQFISLRFTFRFLSTTGEQEKHIVETEFAMISDLGIYLRTDRGAAEK